MGTPRTRRTSRTTGGPRRLCGQETPPPLVSMALFGSTEVFGSTTGGKNQGKTRQGGSAADFIPGTAAGVPRGHQFEKEAEAHGVPTRGCQNYKEAGAHDVCGSGGESGPLLSGWSRPTKRPCWPWPTTGPSGGRRRPGWQRTRGPQRPLQGGPAWAQRMRPGYGENPTNPGSIITDRAPERAYLVVMNGGDHLSVIHHLFRWKAPEGGRSRLNGRLVVFEGEVLDGHGLPRLWRFAKDEERLLQLRPLSVEALEYATKFYQDGDRDDEFHGRQTVPLGVRGATVQTCQRLIPIPVGWVPPDAPVDDGSSRHSRLAPVPSIRERGCSGLQITRLNGTQPSQCGGFTLEMSRIQQSDSLRGHRGLGGPQARIIQAPPPSRPPTRFDLMFGRPAQEEEGDQPWGDSWG